MRPSTLKTGQRVLVRMQSGETRTAYFMRRVPAQQGRPAANYLRFPDYAGLNGPDDDGTCEMSDYDLSRRGELE